MLLFASCGMLTKEALLDVRSDLNDREYQDALVTLESVESDLMTLNEYQQAEFYLLRARTLNALERYEEANEAVNILLSKYSNTDFSAQAFALKELWKDKN